MATTAYFRDNVLRKRPYLRLQWCEAIVQNPMASAVQADGRIRFWGPAPAHQGRFLRVVTLADGKTIHKDIARLRAPSGRVSERQPAVVSPATR